MSIESIDVAISFDSTGSMYPVISTVRRNIVSLVERLFKDIPGIRIAIIAHGDYCDAGSSYVTQTLDFTDDKRAICNFVRNVGRTGGGDSPECYELVLHESRSLNWSSGKSKAFVMIGDDIPHPSTYALNTKKLDWRNELGLLLEAGIHVYAVQALGRRHATAFYREVAEKTGGFHLELDQFSDVREMLMAVCYKQEGDERLQEYEEELVSISRMNRNIDNMIGIMLGREGSSRFDSTSEELGAVSGGRFQVLDVDRDVPIKAFVEEMGATFKKGRGFYEFTKRVKVQGYKEVILMDNATGDLFSGDKAREIAGIPIGIDASVSPGSGDLEGYTCFIQSTSVNRKLLAGTKFLYEVDDWA